MRYEVRHIDVQGAHRTAVTHTIAILIDIRIGDRMLADVPAAFVEVDEAEREPPCEQYPWDGVRNVRPFSKLQANVVEGVY